MPDSLVTGPDASLPDAGLEYRGLGGWLIVIAISLGVSPMLQVMALREVMTLLLDDASWKALTTTYGRAYHPMWATVIRFEIAMGLFFIVTSLVLLTWMFRKLRRFPAAMIVYLILTFVLVTIDYFLANTIPAVRNANSEGYRDVIRAGIGCLVWIPYLLTSRRVKATFVNDPPEVVLYYDPREQRARRMNGTDPRDYLQ